MFLNRILREVDNFTILFFQIQSFSVAQQYNMLEDYNRIYNIIYFK